MKDKAEKIGMAAVKYFDLKQNRIGNYIFEYKKMLDPKGDSAVYLLYAYARICSILKKSGLTDEEIIEAGKAGEYTFSHPHELLLVKKISQFPDILGLVVKDLKINLLCDFTFTLCTLFSEGYNRYKIVGTKEMKQKCMLLFAIRNMLDAAFHMVGINPL
jgi:arginyl-tRNA synthetase